MGDGVVGDGEGEVLAVGWLNTAHATPAAKITAATNTTIRYFVKGKFNPP